MTAFALYADAPVPAKDKQEAAGSDAAAAAPKPFRPAGAVSMFGGVDLFGGGTKLKVVLCVSVLHL